MNFSKCQGHHIVEPNINEWTGVAMLCCHGKSSSYIPASKVIKRSCSYGYISLKSSNAFQSSVSNEM